MNFISLSLKYRTIALLGTGVVFLFLLNACRSDKTEPYQPGHIKLKWHKSYDDDTFEKAIIGLDWALSHVGAKYTIKTSEISYFDETIGIDPSKFGFDSQTRKKLKLLHQRIAESLSYSENGYIDIGHYVALLIGASEHYYELTGVPETLSELESQYALSPEVGYLNNSGISLQHRKIMFSDQNGFHQLFISEEIDSITGQTLEFETLDLMENGQPRFGVFDANGSRIIGAVPTLASAGKPGKCMWCHESGINPIFDLQAPQAGYLSPPDFSDTVIHFRNEHQNSQNALINGVDYQNVTEHILMELLYISYMEPSAARLALEWNMTESEVTNLLTGLPLHEQEEFTFLGLLYDRKDVEGYAPLTALPVSSSVREVGGVEVNYLD